jgi:hypothetical protein
MEGDEFDEQNVEIIESDFLVDEDWLVLFGSSVRHQVHVIVMLSVFERIQWSGALGTDRMMDKWKCNRGRDGHFVECLRLCGSRRDVSVLAEVGGRPFEEGDQECSPPL